jgi:hypothetical protein
VVEIEINYTRPKGRTLHKNDKIFEGEKAQPHNNADLVSDPSAVFSNALWTNHLTTWRQHNIYEYI